MAENNTNWGQSVAGVLIRENKVLLARHTYGNGKGLLIVPGGYIEYGESPQEALKREYREEVKLEIEPEEIIGIRFNNRDWYVVFKARYISGTASSDNDENDEVVWLDINEALNRDDVPDLTKSLIKSAVSGNNGLTQQPYTSQNTPCSFYGNM